MSERERSSLPFGNQARGGFVVRDRFGESGIPLLHSTEIHPASVVHVVLRRQLENFQEGCLRLVMFPELFQKPSLAKKDLGVRRSLLPRPLVEHGRLFQVSGFSEAQRARPLEERSRGEQHLGIVGITRDRLLQEAIAANEGVVSL